MWLSVIDHYRRWLISTSQKDELVQLINPERTVLCEWHEPVKFSGTFNIAIIYYIKDTPVKEDDHEVWFKEGKTIIKFMKLKGGVLKIREYEYTEPFAIDITLLKNLNNTVSFTLQNGKLIISDDMITYEMPASPRWNFHVETRASRFRDLPFCQSVNLFLSKNGPLKITGDTCMGPGGQKGQKVTCYISPEREVY